MAAQIAPRLLKAGGVANLPKIDESTLSQNYLIKINVTFVPFFFYFLV